MINAFKNNISIGIELDDEYLRLAIVSFSSNLKVINSREIKLPPDLIEGGRVVKASKLAWQVEAELDKAYPKWRTIRNLVFCWPERLTYYHFLKDADLPKNRAQIPAAAASSLPLDPANSVYAPYKFEFKNHTIGFFAAASRDEICRWQSLFKKLGRSDAKLDLTSQSIFRILSGFIPETALVLDMISKPAAIYHYSSRGLLSVNWISSQNSEADSSLWFASTISELKKAFTAAEDKYGEKPEKLILICSGAREKELQKEIEKAKIIAKVELANDLFKNQIGSTYIKAVGAARCGMMKSHWRKDDTLDIDWSDAPSAKGQAGNMAKLKAGILGKQLFTNRKFIILLVVLSLLLLAGVSAKVIQSYNKATTKKIASSAVSNMAGEKSEKIIPPVERGTVRLQVILAIAGGQNQVLKARLIKVRVAKAENLAAALKQGKALAEKYLAKGEVIFELPLQRYASSTPLKYPISLSWLAYQKKEYDLMIDSRAELTAGKQNLEIESVKTLGLDTVSRDVYAAWLEAGYRIEDKVSTSTKVEVK